MNAVSYSYPPLLFYDFEKHILTGISANWSSNSDSIFWKLAMSTLWFKGMRLEVVWWAWGWNILKIIWVNICIRCIKSVLLAYVDSIFSDSYIFFMVTHAAVKGKYSGHPGITYWVKIVGKEN